jgi:preprotein translocase subunit SecA
VNLADPVFLGAIQGIILRTMDMFWVDHLEMMEHLRSSVNLRAYGQRDPLVEYKKEGLRFFRDMEASTARQVGEFIANLNVEGLSKQAAEPALPKSSDIPSEHGQTLLGPEMPGVGRNDLCPCGSGKKYKKCGLLNTPEHQRLMAEKR